MDKAVKTMLYWRSDWNAFIRDVFKASLDNEQQEIIHAVQHNPMVAVSSGTARGKDFVAACAALCFLYLTPVFKGKELIGNTKVALTAPSGRQITNIMIPEISRLWKKAGFLPGRMVANDIRTDYEEWFLTGFKSDNFNTEVWSGFHAVNTMFVVTEATGIVDLIYDAIEGNLQGNSRLLLVFNPNVTSGYAAEAMMSTRFKSFRLNSLNATNVVEKKTIIPGQVDYRWVKDKVETWCTPIERIEEEGDFEFEGKIYRPRPDYKFREKVLGMFPKVDSGLIVPLEWLEIAYKRYEEGVTKGHKPIRIGVDVAGMGRDSSVLCYRSGDVINDFYVHHAGGEAKHMHIAGTVSNALINNSTKAFIDTIGEGAGVYSRLEELGYNNAFSCKFSENARGLEDVTGQYQFINMRAYLFWAVRDWLNPANGHKPAIKRNDALTKEAGAIGWEFLSDGKIKIESKKDIMKKIKKSTDYFDALALTFYPHDDMGVDDLGGIFF